MENLNLALNAFVVIVFGAKWKILKFSKNMKIEREVVNIDPPELIFTAKCRERPREVESGLKMEF